MRFVYSFERTNKERQTDGRATVFRQHIGIKFGDKNKQSPCCHSETMRCLRTHLAFSASEVIRHAGAI